MRRNNQNQNENVRNTNQLRQKNVLPDNQQSVVIEPKDLLRETGGPMKKENEETE